MPWPWRKGRSPEEGDSFAETPTPTSTQTHTPTKHVNFPAHESEKIMTSPCGACLDDTASLSLGSTYYTDSTDGSTPVASPCEECFADALFCHFDGRLGFLEDNDGDSKLADSLKKGSRRNKANPTTEKIEESDAQEGSPAEEGANETEVPLWVRFLGMFSAAAPDESQGGVSDPERSSMPENEVAESPVPDSLKPKTLEASGNSLVENDADEGSNKEEAVHEEKNVASKEKAGEVKAKAQLNSDGTDSMRLNVSEEMDDKSVLLQYSVVNQDSPKPDNEGPKGSVNVGKNKVDMFTKAVECSFNPPPSSESIPKEENSTGNEDKVKSCTHCGIEESEEKNIELKMCSRCQQAYYCSTNCQTKDWHKGHKKICRPPYLKKKFVWL